MKEIYNDLHFLEKVCRLLRECYDIYSKGGKLHYTDMIDCHDFMTVEECFTEFIVDIMERDALNPDTHV